MVTQLSETNLLGTGGRKSLIYQDHHPIPSISYVKSRDRGRDFSAISRPPPYLQFKIQNLGTVISSIFPGTVILSTPRIGTQLSHDDAPFPGLSPNFLMMVSHLSFDSHPPSTGWLHNLLRLIFPSMVTNISRMIAHLPFLGWLLTFPRMVTNLPNDGQPPFLGWATRFNVS